MSQHNYLNAHVSVDVSADLTCWSLSVVSNTPFCHTLNIFWDCYHDDCCSVNIKPPLNVSCSSCSFTLYQSTLRSTLKYFNNYVIGCCADVDEDESYWLPPLSPPAGQNLHYCYRKSQLLFDGSEQSLVQTFMSLSSISCSDVFTLNSLIKCDFFFLFMDYKTKSRRENM